MKCSGDTLPTTRNLIWSQGSDFQVKSFQFERKVSDFNKLKFDSEKLEANEFAIFSTNSQIHSCQMKSLNLIYFFLQIQITEQVFTLKSLSKQILFIMKLLG